MLLLLFFCLLMAAVVRESDGAEFDLYEISNDLPYFIVVDERGVNVECRDGIESYEAIGNIVRVGCNE